MIDRRVEAIRESWLGDIRKIVSAPAGSEIAVFTRGGTEEDGAPAVIRLTTEPGAPVYGKLEPDRTHPYLQKDAISEINSRLPRGVRQVNTYDIQAVRAALEVSEATHPEWIHQPKFGSKQYSDAFVDWMVEQHSRDNDFLQRARDSYYDLQYGKT